MSSERSRSFKPVHHPKRFQEDLDQREKDLFKKNIPHNGTLNIKYKGKLFGQSYSLVNENAFSQKPGNSKIRNYMGFSASKDIKKTNFEINGDVELDQTQPKLNLHMHSRFPLHLLFPSFNFFSPENRKISLSASVGGESDRLKNFKAALTYQGFDYKGKLQLSNPLGKDGSKPWEYQFTFTKAFYFLEQYGANLVHEESVSSGNRIDGMSLLKFEKNPQTNYGILVAHKVGLTPLNLNFRNFTFFYNHPKTLLSLQIHNILKPMNDFSAFISQKYTRNMEVGVLFESGRKGTKIHFGVTHQVGTGNLKFKINDKLHCGWSYKWSFQKNTVICVGGHFPLTKAFESEHQNSLYPFGLKIEFKDEK